MEFLENIFGGGTDLAAVASGAGLFGGGASAAAAMMVSGAIKRFVFRTLLTGVLTGGGFLFLLHYLGFQIVPPEDLQNPFPFGQSLDEPGVQEEASNERNGREPAKIIYVRSPYDRG